MKHLPHLKHEISLWEKGYLVCGIDEVGRGAFAGPLVVGGVILKPIEQSNNLTMKQLLSLGINDSKLLSKKNRELIKDLLQEYVLFSSYQYISVSQINQIGVGNANKLGFELVAKETLFMARGAPASNEIFFLTDAFKIPRVPSSKQKNIIRGDQTSISIAAASILAKVERDSFMENLALEHPEYGFEKHKGYGTLFHRDSIKQHGATSFHREDFIRNCT